MSASSAPQSRRDASHRGRGSDPVPFPVDRTSPPVERAPEVSDFLQGGELVPAHTANPVVDLREGSGPLREVIAGGADVLNELRRAASADNTRRSYGRHVLAFSKWCEDAGVSALPATPETVEAHLLWYLLGSLDSDEAPRDEDGNLIAEVCVDTAGIRLAAINKLHEYAGFDKPGASTLVSDFMRGARRYFGSRPVGAKEAIDHAGLRGMVAVAKGGRYGSLKKHLVILLRAEGLSCGQIARLSWSDVTVAEDRVVVEVPRDRRGGGGATVRLPSRPSDPVMCPVALVRALRDLAPGRSLGWLFVSSDDSQEPMTRQGVMAVCNSMGAAAGGYSGLPGASRDAVRGVLVAATRQRAGRGLRDEALLTAGWFLAARRGNLSDLQWRDLSFTEDGAVRVLFRRSKTDQEGRGAVLWLRDVDGAREAGLLSPTRALREWREWVSDQIGGDPREVMPRGAVFAHMTKDGSLQRTKDGSVKRLSGARINQVVQEYAEAAGLESVDFEGADSRRKSPFGAHSLRAGFVTEAARGGKLPIARIMEVTQHQSASMVIRYVREANDRQSNAVTDLLGRMLAEDDDAGGTAATG